MRRPPRERQPPPPNLPPTRAELRGEPAGEPTLSEIKNRKLAVRFRSPENMLEFVVTHSEAAAREVLKKDSLVGVMTADEMVDFMCWARRAREAGKPYSIDDLARVSMLRGRADMGLEYVESWASKDQPPEMDLMTSGFAKTHAPPGWKTGGIEACSVCKRGTVWVDPSGAVKHPTCGGT